MRFDLADLHLFLCVVDAGSITHGAERAHLALASASERLRRMEADAGIALLARHARGVHTTQAGEALAHHARLMVQQQAVLKNEMRDFAVGARGTLHLYVNTAAMTEYLPARLAPWLAQRPQLHIELKERGSNDIVRAVGTGLIEAGIISDAIAAPDLVVQPVAQDHLVLLVPQAHRLANHKSVSLSQLHGESFVGLTVGKALQDHLEEQASASGPPLVWRIRMKTFEGVCHMVSHGVGLAIVPKNVAQRYRRQMGYRVVALSDAWAQRNLCLCFKDWQSLSLPMQALLTYLESLAQPRKAKVCG